MKGGQLTRDSSQNKAKDCFKMLDISCQCNLNKTNGVSFYFYYISVEKDCI